MERKNPGSERPGLQPCSIVLAIVVARLFRGGGLCGVAQFGGSANDTFFPNPAPKPTSRRKTKTTALPQSAGR